MSAPLHRFVLPEYVLSERGVRSISGVGDVLLDVPFSPLPSYSVYSVGENEYSLRVSGEEYFRIGVVGGRVGWLRTSLHSPLLLHISGLGVGDVMFSGLGNFSSVELDEDGRVSSVEVRARYLSSQHSFSGGVVVSPRCVVYGYEGRRFELCQRGLLPFRVGSLVCGDVSCASDSCELSSVSFESLPDSFDLLSSILLLFHSTPGVFSYHVSQERIELIGEGGYRSMFSYSSTSLSFVSF